MYFFPEPANASGEANDSSDDKDGEEDDFESLQERWDLVCIDEIFESVRAKIGEDKEGKGGVWRELAQILHDHLTIAQSLFPVAIAGHDENEAKKKKDNASKKRKHTVSQGATESAAETLAKSMTQLLAVQAQQQSAESQQSTANIEKVLTMFAASQAQQLLQQSNQADKQQEKDEREGKKAKVVDVKAEQLRAQNASLFATTINVQEWLSGISFLWPENSRKDWTDTLQQRFESEGIDDARDVLQLNDNNIETLTAGLPAVVFRKIQWVQGELRIMQQ